MLSLSFPVAVGSSLSARRAWIEMSICGRWTALSRLVALRKESVDRNRACTTTITICTAVALRKESVDRNSTYVTRLPRAQGSLSARRAWIEISIERLWNDARSCRSPQGERG